MLANTKKEGIISVTEITKSIKLLLENHIGLISVEGEVSNYKPHYSGHRYFTLKDENAQISCTMWKSRPINFEMTDGQKIVVTGTISVYPPRGNYQIDVISAIPAGIGDLYQAYELLKQKLQGLGYFDSEIKKHLPEMPMNIGVSTSPTGAAVKDIFSTIHRRFPAANIYFRPTIVQGDSASNDIANAIKELINTPSEIIIIGRGGGSIEDLWAYNTEIVAEAIHNCPTPIISAVGHETDFTIADFVADVRAATPTAAAELSTPLISIDVVWQFKEFQNSLTTKIQEFIADNHSIINDFANNRNKKLLLDSIHYNFQFLDSLVEPMQKDINHTIKQNINSVNSLENQCKALSPIAPLTRGFALIKHNNNYILNNESLSKYKKFEIIREKEKVIASFDKIIFNDLFA